LRNRAYLAEGLEHFGERRHAMHHRRLHAFEPQQGEWAAGRDGAAKRQFSSSSSRQVRGARHVERQAHGGRHRLDRLVIVETDQRHARLGLRPRQGLDRHLGQRRQRAPRAGHELAEVVAGDVLHHPPPGLEGLAAARHRREAQEMIARRAGLDPAWAGKVGGERAADRTLAGRSTEQRPVVHRLEGELLAPGIDQRLDLGDRRSRAGGQHQLLGLVERHTAKPGEIERQVGLRRPADRALRGVADNLQRFLLRQRPADGLFDVLAVAGLQRVRHRASLLALPRTTASAS
jgi:hypothetical protein